MNESPSSPEFQEHMRVKPPPLIIKALKDHEKLRTIVTDAGLTLPPLQTTRQIFETKAYSFGREQEKTPLRTTLFTIPLAKTKQPVVFFKADTLPAVLPPPPAKVVDEREEQDVMEYKKLRHDFSKIESTANLGGSIEERKLARKHISNFFGRSTGEATPTQWKQSVHSPQNN